MVKNNRDIEILKKLGTRLKQVRELKSISQEELALKLGTTQKQIWKIEQGISDPTYCRLNAMATIFEMSISELLQIPENTGIKIEEQL